MVATEDVDEEEEEEKVVLAATIAFRCTMSDVRWAFQEERKGSYSGVDSHGSPNMARRKQTRRKHHGSPLALQPDPEFFVSRYSFLQPLAEGAQSPY